MNLHKCPHQMFWARYFSLTNIHPIILKHVMLAQLDSGEQRVKNKISFIRISLFVNLKNLLFT